MINYKKLSKRVSHALRHKPQAYHIELDHEGWTSIESLLASLRTKNREWKNLTKTDLEEMIFNTDKLRHEISGDRIRCLYGHSLKDRIEKVPVTPPEFLFHGTSPASIESILENGLLPMNRQYVHLSEDIETARIVGSRKDRNPSILKIAARNANKGEIHFYHGSEKIWLADKIPPEFIKMVDE